MDASELLSEFTDRHAAHLVYEGPYRLVRAEPRAQVPIDLARLFEEWRQRVYHFDNDLGASVVLYRPLTRRRMTWDLMLARFLGQDPLAFETRGAIRRNLGWREVQIVLDGIRARGSEDPGGP